jgi:hypothetical protein
VLAQQVVEFAEKHVLMQQLMHASVSITPSSLPVNGWF